MIGKIVKGIRVIGVVIDTMNDVYRIKYAAFHNNYNDTPFSCKMRIKNAVEPTSNEIERYKKYLLKHGYLYINGDVVKNEEF